MGHFFQQRRIDVYALPIGNIDYPFSPRFGMKPRKCIQIKLNVHFQSSSFYDNLDAARFI